MRPDAPTPRPARQHGMTLIELLVAIAVLAIVATLGVPGFQRFSARQEVVVEVLRIKTALAMTRSTAITRRTKSAVCSSPPPHEACAFDNWNHDWIIVEGKITNGNLAGLTILRRLKRTDGISVSFSRDDRPVQYGRLGRSSGYNGTFSLCGRADAGAQIVVSNFGRVRVTAERPACLDT